MKEAEQKKVDDYLAALSGPFKELILKLREIILASDNKITEDIKWGNITFNCKGNICGIIIAKKHVSIAFFHGVDLDDPYKVLITGSGKKIRSVKYASLNDINKKALQGLTKSAVRLNAG